MIYHADFLFWNQNLSLELSSGDSNGNSFFTVLVGSNGTSKSRILASLAYEINSSYWNKRKKIPASVVGCNLMTSRFTNLIAVSSSPYDKFPTVGPMLDENGWFLGEGDGGYFYLGIRSKNGQGLKNNSKRVFEVLLSSVLGEKNGNAVHAWDICFKKLNLKKQVVVEFAEGDARSYFDRQNKKIQDVNVVELPLDVFLTLSRKVAKNRFEFHLDIGSQTDLKALGGLLQFERLGKFKISKISVQKLNSDEAYNLLDASSGELSLLIHGLGLSSCLKDGAVILIDEPEISLHPNWQVEYVVFLKELVGTYRNCHFIIATHSPHILSGLSSRESIVLSIKRNSVGMLEVDSINSERGFWSIEKLLLDVFGIQNAHNQEFEAMVADAVSLIADSSATNRKKRLLNLVERFERFDLDPFDPLIELISDAREVLNDIT